MTGKDSAAMPSRDSRATGRTGGNGVSSRRDTDGSHLGLSFRHPAIHFLNRLLNLGAAPLDGSGFELPLQLGPRQTQRLERLRRLGIFHGFPPLPPAVAFELLHSFLDARIRINQAF